MGNFAADAALAIDPATVEFDVVYAADPVTMQTNLQAYIDALAARVANFQIIEDLALAGAGDGHAFVVQIMLGPSLSAQTALTVNVFEASSPTELQDAATAALAQANDSIESMAVAGASQGRRWMGIILSEAVG